MKQNVSGVPATDGTKVPVSIVYRKDKFRKDGTMPFYLYAYGSYGANSDPYFNSSAISLLTVELFMGLRIFGADRNWDVTGLKMADC